MTVKQYRYTYSIKNHEATNVDIAGGKGANLALLSQRGFKVPDAYIVSISAFHSWLAQLNAPDVLDGLFNDGLSQPDRVRQYCCEIKERLLLMSFPQQVRDELTTNLQTLCDKGPVSVRSSATLEDLPGSAFAGQHETFLGVSGINTVLDKIIECYVSLWDYRAVRYRHEQGFSEHQMAMAVVVQEMVNADCAGVAFSANPINGNLNEIVVNSAFGLGESVVSGMEAIDQYTINKNGVVLETNIGTKKSELKLRNSVLQAVPISSNRQIQGSLTAGQLKQLGKLTKAVERSYGFPQDIEWAILEDELYLLQSRPVSFMAERWTRQESAERFPNPVTPLTWDFTTPGFHDSLSYSLNTLQLPAHNGRWFERFNGFIYGNQTAVEVYTTSDSQLYSSLNDVTKALPKLVEQCNRAEKLADEWLTQLGRYLHDLSELANVELGSVENVAILNHINRLELVGNRYFRPNIAISLTHGLIHKLLYRIVSLQSTDVADEVYAKLTCFSETKTSAVNKSLYDLYLIAREEPGLKQLLCETNRRTLFDNGSLEQFSEFNAAFRCFIDEHGHRETDFDAIHPTWSGQPWVVLETLRAMLLQSSVPNPAARVQTLKKTQINATCEFIALLPVELQSITKRIVELCQLFTELDDIEHYHTTRLSVPFRAAVTELGRRFCTKGLLEKDTDLFFLDRSSFVQFVNGQEQQKGQELIRKNKFAYKQQLATDPPFELDIAASIHAGNVEQPCQVNTESGGLSGLAGSPGVATGKTCIVRSTDDFEHFIPGSVLVARTTNPAWTPLFYSASAVITESGGPLSHGAVTAREIGIPAVVAVHGAIHELGDGCDVLVNGAEGSVQKLGKEQCA